MEVNPVAVILVYMDSKGDRLLYKFPYQEKLDKLIANNTTSTTSLEPSKTTDNVVTQTTNATTQQQTAKKRNPYAVSSNADDILQPSHSNSNNISAPQLQAFSDEVLSTLFAVKQELCNQKFELKVNDVRFVSHPTLMQRKEPRVVAAPPTTTQTAPTLTPSIAPTSGAVVAGSGATVAAGIVKPQPQQMLINIVFALQAQASYSIVKCYYELSKRLGQALKVEEGHTSDETALMARTHDEFAAQQQPLERAFDAITARSSLAQALKSIYHDLCTTGLLSTKLNQNLTLSFCLPQKAHQMHKKGSLVDPTTIDRCLRALKPYHGMLLLVDFAELLDCVPPTGARMLLQLVEVYTPLMSLQSMASDADLIIEHVYKLVSHLVYWAKATIIYPLCETNVYVIAPDAPLHTKSHLVEKFSTRFAGMSLFEVIADFSLPTSIGHLTTPLQQPARQGILAQMVLWMLQHHLLMQLHTYVQFMPSDLTDETLLADGDETDADEGVDDEEEDAVVSSTSLLELRDCSTAVGAALVAEESEIEDDLNGGSSLLSISSPLPVPHTSRRSITEDHYSGGGSTTSDNIAAQPSSSHKSNFSMTASLSTENCDSIASIEDEEKVKELLQVFDEADRAAIRRIPAATNVDDLSLMVKLYQAGYFKSEHHLEEIMYFENLRRSQLLQLLDKFREVLIIYETEDPAIATMYNK